MFNVDFFRFLRIGVGGAHDKIVQEDLDYEKLGGPLRGDVLRKVWTGLGQVGAVLRLAGFEINPFLSYDVSSNSMSSISRIIEEAQAGDDPYPQDTYAFVDLTEDELIHGPHAGVNLNWRPSRFVMAVQGAWSPYLMSQMTTSYVHNMTGTRTPNTSPSYMWLEHESSFEGTGSRYAAQASLGYFFKKISLQVMAYRRYGHYRYEGNTTIVNTVYSAMVNPDSSLTIIDGGTTPVLADVQVKDANFEAGISLSLTRFSWAPILDAAYVRIIRDIENNFIYEGTAERWVEDYDYFRIALKWGF